MAQSVIGGPYTASDETTVYANSGMVSFTVAAAAFYDMLQFTDQRDIRWTMSFSCDWDVVEASNDAVGVVVTIGGVAVVRHVTEGGLGNNGPPGPFGFEFFVPADMEVDIDLLNPDAGASLVQANVTLVGKVIQPLIKGPQATDSSGALGSAAKFIPKSAPPPDKAYPDADLFPDLPSVPTDEWFGKKAKGDF